MDDVDEEPGGDARRRAPKGRAPRAAGRTEVLTREEILAAAIDLADQGELDRLTMRRLAEVLQVSAMSLYARVADKDEILDAIIDHRLRTGGLPEPSGDWLGWMSEVAQRLRQMLVHEPALLDRYCRRPVGVPAALERMEASLVVLDRVGFDGPDAVEVFAAVHTYTIGFAALESARRAGSVATHGDRSSSSDAEGGHWPAYFGALDHTRFPRLVELRPDLAAFTGDGQFKIGLETLLAGLAARFLSLVDERAADGQGKRPG